jgi:hypothetical protein
MCSNRYFLSNRAPKMRGRHELLFGLRLLSKEFQHLAIQTTKFALVSLTLLVAKLPLISTTPVVLVTKFAASVVDTGGAP